MKTHFNPDLWKKAESAKVGEMIACPSCGKKHKKKTYQHKFCNTQCKDNYWNDEPSRRDRGSLLGYCHSEEELERMQEDHNFAEMGWDAHKDSW